MSRAPDDEDTTAPGRGGTDGAGRRSADHAIGAIAAQQHGVVTRAQILEAGLSSAAVTHRLARGTLHRVHPGVYAAGHRGLSERGWWMAAVLSGGAGALLSHRSAAVLWGLVEKRLGPVDVLLTRAGTARPGVRIHRSRTVPDVDRATVDGIPVTSVARTIIDLAPFAGERRVDRALRRADDLRLLDVPTLEKALERGRPGTPVVRAALRAVSRDARDDVRTKRELEQRFRELLLAHRFELPRVNVSVGTPWQSYEVDALWPKHRLVVELDGWEAHRDRESFRRDHRRDADLVAAGYRVVRLTWDQVTEDGAATVARLARVLAARP